MLLLCTTVLYNSVVSFHLSSKASVCFIGWKAIPVTKAFNSVCLHTRWIIAIEANMERIAAMKGNISIIILLKNEHLLLSLLDLSDIFHSVYTV